MEAEVINYGWLSLIPAIVAVVLAFATRNVVLSLAISLFTGILIQVGWNPWTGLQMLFSDYLFVDMASGNNPQTVIMMMLVGGFVALIEKSGGARAFAQMVSSKINTKVKSQIAVWLSGLAIYFSDSGNSLILGPIFRPVFDRVKSSRAKLAYILDSTSSPVCILIPITGWGVYVTSIIATEYGNLGIQGSEMGTFVQAIPYQFYAILALVLIPIVAMGKKDFGFMARAEEQARLDLPQQTSGEEEIVVSDDKKVSPWNMLLPLIVMFAVILIMFFAWGFPFKNIAGSKIRIALCSGYFLACITIIIMVVYQKLMTFTEAFNIFIGGMQKMTSIMVVIVIAWSVGSVCSDLGTSQFVVDATLGIITPKVVPALLFLVGTIISFATGTSWGTMAILLPLGINMAYSFEVSIPVTIAAVLSGSLFGDHCSPISDTTVMSAMAAESDLMEHVKTQLPYAGIAALASFVSYLILGFTNLPAAAILVISIVILVVFYLVACKVWGVELDSTEENVQK